MKRASRIGRKVTLLLLAVLTALFPLLHSTVAATGTALYNYAEVELSENTETTVKKNTNYRFRPKNSGYYSVIYKCNNKSVVEVKCTTGSMSETLSSSDNYLYIYMSSKNSYCFYPSITTQTTSLRVKYESAVSVPQITEPIILQKGEARTFEFSVSDAASYIDKINTVIYSDNTEIAEVTELNAVGKYNNSEIKFSSSVTLCGKAEGMASLFIITPDGNETEYPITVKKAPPDLKPTAVITDITSKTVYIGDSLRIIATVSPSELADTPITYISDDSSVATVTQNGTVTALKPGVTNIVCAVSEGVFTTVKITVLQVPSIEITQTEKYRIRGGILYSAEPLTVSEIKKLLCHPDCSIETEYNNSALTNGNSQAPTGTRASLLFRDDTIDSVIFALLGDADKDGVISVNDARCVLRHAIKLDTLDNIGLLAVLRGTGSDSITVEASRLILRAAIKLETIKYHN